MPTFKQAITPELIARWIAKGKGRGEGLGYKPWLTVFDFSSRGLRTRIMGATTGRIHHLFSLLELTFFYLADLDDGVIDIREQFPLFPHDDTVKIAEHLGIKHPTDPKSQHPIVMTTDLLITIRSGDTVRHEAWSIKYHKDLYRHRTLQKLEIERRFWRTLGIPWHIFTNAWTSKTLISSLRRLHPYKSPDSIAFISPDVVQTITECLSKQVRSGTVLAPITTSCDRQLGLRPGTSLQVARHLQANSFWPIDLTKSIAPRDPLTFIEHPIRISQRGLYATSR